MRSNYNYVLPHPSKQPLVFPDESDKHLEFKHRRKMALMKKWQDIQMMTEMGRMKDYMQTTETSHEDELDKLGSIRPLSTFLERQIRAEV